jgi:hypothetical protein
LAKGEEGKGLGKIVKEKKEGRAQGEIEIKQKISEHGNGRNRQATQGLYALQVCRLKLYVSMSVGTKS